MTNQNAIDALNNLLARTYDAENGYKEAAENVKDSHLVAMFKANAEQRYTFGHEIKDCLKSLGGTPDKGQSIAGQVHQVWMDVRNALTSDDDVTILKEVNRGEEYALEAYAEALDNIKTGTPEYDRIVAQRNQVRTVFERTQSLETIYAS